MNALNEYVQKLERLKTENQTAIGLIARFLLNNLESKIIITQAQVIANEIGVSNAMISKFSKAMGFENIYEILFLQKLTKKLSSQKKQETTSLQIKKASILIEKARKIFFIGVSNGFSINQDFARKINRLDKWTYVSDNKYEQIGNARLLVAKDVLIVTSVSLQHAWMRYIIKNTPAKVILISSTLPENLKNQITLFFQVFSIISDTIHRNVTYEPRINALKIFDQIYQELISYDHNKLLLETTRYNKN